MFIVIEDRKGEWWEGALVDDSRARQLEAQGVVLLPIVPDLLKKSGVGGFHKRSWGSGWQLDALTPRVVCPVTMYCSQAFNQLNWVAKVIPSKELLERLDQNGPEPASGALQGFIKICSDAGQSISYKASVMPKEEYLLKDLSRTSVIDGAFYLHGTGKLMLPSDAHYGFGLYAMGTGLRIVWLAVSQSLA